MILENFPFGIKISWEWRVAIDCFSRLFQQKIPVDFVLVTKPDQCARKLLFVARIEVVLIAGIDATGKLLLKSRNSLHCARIDNLFYRPPAKVALLHFLDCIRHATAIYKATLGSLVSFAFLAPSRHRAHSEGTQCVQTEALPNRAVNSDRLLGHHAIHAHPGSGRPGTSTKWVVSWRLSCFAERFEHLLGQIFLGRALRLRIVEVNQGLRDRGGCP